LNVWLPFGTIIEVGIVACDHILGQYTHAYSIAKENSVATQWFYSPDGQKMLGPCSSLEMKQLASTGKILPGYRVRRKGRATTVMAKNVKGLFLPANG
jgi:GYF domain 2